jgi:hypothetical protein
MFYLTVLHNRNGKDGRPQIVGVAVTFLGSIRQVRAFACMVTQLLLHAIPSFGCILPLSSSMKESEHGKYFLTLIAPGAKTRTWICPYQPNIQA